MLKTHSQEDETINEKSNDKSVQLQTRIGLFTPQRQLAEALIKAVVVLAHH